MLSTTQLTEDSGRVVVHTKDDRGEPEGFNNAAPADFRQFSTFQERITIPMGREETHGSFRLGTLLLSAQISTGALFTGTTLALEVVIVGYVGTAPTVLKSTIFGAFLTQDVVGFDDSTSYDSIGILGRQLVDGLPDSTQVVAALSLQAAARFTR